MSADVSVRKRQVEDGSEASPHKRTKGGPSMVLHVRALPADAMEAEVYALARPFGEVVRVLMLKGKSQAFVQFASLDSAIAMIRHHEAVPGQIRGQSVFFQFSNHNEIKPPAGQQMSQIERAPQSWAGGSSLEPTVPPAAMDGNAPASPVIHITISNCAYPVDVDTLHKVFSRCGLIEKILMFQKNSIQALVQFASVSSALNARRTLDGECIWSGVCQLRIQFSKLQSINVKKNDDTSWDFTTTTFHAAPEPPRGVLDGPMPPMSQMGPMGYGNEKMGPMGYGNEKMGPMGYGNEKMGPMGYGNEKMGPMGYGNEFAMAPHNAAAGGAPGGGAGCVVLLNNLPDEATPDNIFTLCSVYGRVARVKILYNKRSSALVEFTAPHYAESALKHLGSCPMYGNEIHILVSKHAGISIRHEDNGKMTKDFTHCDPHLHRYAEAIAADPRSEKQLAQACAPSSVLHLANISASTSSDEIRQLFARFGTVVNLKELPSKGENKKQMYLLELGSQKESVNALLELHGHVLADGNKLRVSFTKSIIKGS